MSKDRTFPIEKNFKIIISWYPKLILILLLFVLTGETIKDKDPSLSHGSMIVDIDFQVETGNSFVNHGQGAISQDRTFADHWNYIGIAVQEPKYTI